MHSDNAYPAIALRVFRSPQYPPESELAKMARPYPSAVSMGEPTWHSYSLPPMITIFSSEVHQFVLGHTEPIIIKSALEYVRP